MDLTRRTENIARRGFRYFNHFMVGLWRLGMGRWVNAWPQVGGRVMVLTHRGRRSGRTYRTPVNYAVIDGDVYCVAGFGHVSDWYRNVLEHPEVEVWLPDGWWTGLVEELGDVPGRLDMVRQVLIASGFAARAIGLDPLHDSDDMLRAVAGKYPLLRIQRGAPRTGAGGPGDLAWFWPLAALVLLAWSLRRRRR